MVKPMIDPTLPPWPERPALFLDLDGTLLEIADEPQNVRVSARVRALLPRLHSATGGAAALISGRPIADLDRLVAPFSFPAAGIHGLERRDGGGRIHSARIDSGMLAPARATIAAFVTQHPGLLFEDKGPTLALHYRKRPDLAAQVGRFVAELEHGLPPAFAVLGGRMVYEIKPRGVDKGLAIAAFMQEPPFVGRTALFVGDDLTDEAGFKVVNELAGVSVKVHAGPTAARWRLADVGAVLGWLERALAYAGPRAPMGVVYE
jgi:trehalose 6-phosphate phosphatase